MDAEALTALLQRHAGLIAKIAWAWCPRPDEREDVMQEIAVQLWRSWHRYDPRYAESTFVYRIALNTAISFERRARRHGARREALDVHAITLAAAPAPEPTEEQERLRLLLDTLPALDKALVLLWLDGNDHASTAAVLGISTSNVSTKLSRIKARLRSSLSEDPHGSR